MSPTALHTTLNISETVRDRGLVPKKTPTGNGLWGIKWSVKLKGKTRDQNTLRAQYLENGWR